MPRPPVVRAKPPSSAIQLTPPGPACSHLSRSAAESRIVSSSTYGCHSPPSIRICVARTPDPSPSVALRSTSTGPSYCSSGASPFSSAVVVGAFGSIRKVTDLTLSVLPSSSVERYSIVCRPSSSTVNGAVYGVHSSSPAKRYSVVSAPEPPSLSVASSVTSTGDVYQPSSPSGSSGSSEWVVRGGVVSPPVSQLSASTVNESKSTSVAGPPPSCLTNRPTLVTPCGPSSLAGNGGAITAKSSPLNEYSVSTFVPSKLVRSHRSSVGGSSFPVFGNWPP